MMPRPGRDGARTTRRCASNAGSGATLQPAVGTAPDSGPSPPARSTLGKVLVIYRMPGLACLDQGTGLHVRTTAPQGYEHENAGDLVHVDIKKLGRIPDGGGHRSSGRAKGDRKRRAGVGYAYLHHSVDDQSRLAYSEILADEQKETAAAFWKRAAASHDRAQKQEHRSGSFRRGDAAAWAMRVGCETRIKGAARSYAGAPRFPRTVARNAGTRAI